MTAKVVINKLKKMEIEVKDIYNKDGVLLRRYINGKIVPVYDYQKPEEDKNE